MAQAKKEFKGSCMGVQLVRRGMLPHNNGRDSHIIVRIIINDDGLWHVDNTFSSHWIDELIEKLQEAKEYMKQHEEPYMHEGHQYGYKFKDWWNR